MQTIEELEGESLIEQIASYETSEPVSAGNERLARIRGIQTVFKQISRTPKILRMMMQKEFDFDGQVDASTLRANKDNESDDRLLEAEWYDSTFVVPNFGRMPLWSKKIAEQAALGKTIVAIIPARTNTSWFHDFVIQQAAEIRFIRGRLMFPGHKTQSPLPDVIAVYRGAKPHLLDGEEGELTGGANDLRHASNADGPKPTAVLMYSSIMGHGSMKKISSDEYTKDGRRKRSKRQTFGAEDGLEARERDVAGRFYAKRSRVAAKRRAEREQREAEKAKEEEEEEEDEEDEEEEESSDDGDSV